MMFLLDCILALSLPFVGWWLSGLVCVMYDEKEGGD